MKETILQNKPLVEAIFEVRWELEEPVPGIKIDPQYKLLIGRIYDRIADEFPIHEMAPAAIMPDEMAAYTIQHRFRKSKAGWPLIQLGPGIITLNDTEGYTWESFRIRIHKLLDSLHDAYPDSSCMVMHRLLLRYIDAIEFDYQQKSALDFLASQMKSRIAFSEDLFQGTGVSNLPLHFDLRFSFAAGVNVGNLHLRFVRGKKNQQDALIWETTVESAEESKSLVTDRIKQWADAAHEITHNWFFKIIEGELKRRFE